MILFWERKVHVLTGDFILTSWSSSGRVSLTALIAISSTIFHRFVLKVVHILCSCWNEYLKIIKSSSVIMVVHYLVNFEYSHVWINNISDSNQWICWFKIHFKAVVWCLDCKRCFTISSCAFPDCTFYVLISDGLWFNHCSPFFNLWESVYCACVVVESAVHILLLENPQMNWNILSESWCNCFLCWICSTLSSCWIRPFDCSWSCWLFNDIFSHVFCILNTNKCCNDIFKIIWWCWISSGVFHLEFVKTCADKWLKVYHLNSSIIENQIISSVHLCCEIHSINLFDDSWIDHR